MCVNKSSIGKEILPFDKTNFIISVFKDPFGSDIKVESIGIISWFKLKFR